MLLVRETEWPCRSNNLVDVVNRIYVNIRSHLLGMETFRAASDAWSVAFWIRVVYWVVLWSLGLHQDWSTKAAPTADGCALDIFLMEEESDNWMEKDQAWMESNVLDPPESDDWKPSAIEIYKPEESLKKGRRGRLSRHWHGMPRVPWANLLKVLRHL